jgi:transcriptional regulator with XRE-family HTH domain
MNMQQNERLKQINYLRNHLGWSLKRVARKFGISRQAMTRWILRAEKYERQRMALIRQGPRRRWIRPTSLSNVYEA